MEAGLFLDTHVVVWLAAGELSSLSARARLAIEQAERLWASPIVLLELHFLHESMRLKEEPGQTLLEASRQADVEFADYSFRQVIETSRWLTWTRDPVDRVMVAHAMAAKAPLVTKDKLIRANYAQAIW